jgi:hypothetical protein
MPLRFEAAEYFDHEFIFVVDGETIDRIQEDLEGLSY